MNVNNSTLSNLNTNLSNSRRIENVNIRRIAANANSIVSNKKPIILAGNSADIIKTFAGFSMENKYTYMCKYIYVILIGCDIPNELFERLIKEDKLEIAVLFIELYNYGNTDRKFELLEKYPLLYTFQKYGLVLPDPFGK